jgi:HlyD family secretion protein
MTANVTFVLQKVDNVIKLPNAALRFKPTRDQIMALMERFGGGGPPGPGGPAGGWQRAAAGAPTGMPPPPPEMGGGPAMPASDHKMIWKLAGDRPQIVPVKLGLTDGSMTELLEGAIAPGDALITEVQGVSTSPRKLGAF